ncbi:hypothetical protein AMS68_005801 [Peltaster fructicola]|uniref:Glycoside hydrolase family 5 C-terminal domain-containing protein n=1 Tax=Peltaster fructicola TaxID=286661 RepID=A0A6H0XZW4_9PEZI|nr:hypothetical protein AMS68_005801 [Peltaster fructicola]
MSSYRIRIDGASLRDPHGREVTLHGINVAGDSKLPATPEINSHVKEHFFEGDDVSFVNRPFSVDDAHTHFSRLKSWGYNTIRYIFTWEAIEHAGPGKYDEDFIQHTVKLLRIAKQYEFYVFMDPHQDVWSRYTGGSGAPMWTIYACGLDPEKFRDTQAALVQNMWPEPAEFPKMIWATNYTRLACQVIFTMFFAGKDFFPKCQIDGQNIQDWLQEHFVGACKHLAQRIHEAGDLENDVVIGYESMNEPNKGLIGHPALNTIPPDQKLQKGTSPTPFQAMLTGSGRAVEEATWDFGNLGPYKSGSQLVDPNGVSTWLDPRFWDDTKYGWKRADSWKLGEDIFAQHGIWDPKNDELMLPRYFATIPGTDQKVDQEFFTNHYFMDYFRRYKNAIRDVWPEAIMLIQPSPFEIPPHIKGTKDEDPNMIFASHFYDGITLITKKWNRYWNVDVLGVLRGRYSSPAFAVKVGEAAVRNCFRDQLSAIKKEGTDYMGEHPLIFTEIGIPYDMDDKHAYKTGDYFSQSLAVDANHYAVEGSNANGFTWWVYTASNSHYWGDNWNGEDLSIYCSEDKLLPDEKPVDLATHGGSKESLAADQKPSTPPVSPAMLKKTLSVDGMTTSLPPALSSSETRGHRAAEAYVRATPVYTHGTIKSHAFDLRSGSFHLVLTAPSSTPQDYPTEIFLPEYHFPQSNTSVVVSGGKWKIAIEDIEGVDGSAQQMLRWWHSEGEQKITVKGVKKPRGKSRSEEAADEGYLEQYLQMGKSCTLM